MINYYLITKPGIILGNLFTFAAGFLLGVRGPFPFLLFFITLMALGLVIASACVFNNYIDLDRDRQMKRTKNRPLVQGKISKEAALTFGTGLGLCGFALLYFFTNLPAFLFAAAGFFIYVLIYSLFKSHTIYGTAIGSLAGATPPVIGYAAAHGTLDLPALLLFVMLVLWQMPHFYAITLLYMKDYALAQIPVLPLERGVYRTKMHMALYVLAFLPSVLLFSLLGYAGVLFFSASALLGAAWIGLSLQGFTTDNDQVWSRHMFQWSLVVIGAICILLPLDSIKS